MLTTHQVIEVFDDEDRLGYAVMREEQTPSKITRTLLPGLYVHRPEAHKAAWQLNIEEVRA